MSVRTYRVKYYGFTAPDRETFFRDFARVLGITQEAARDLALDAPVTIREDLDKATAERLLQSITAIQGLCLMEGMDGSFAEQESLQPERLLPVPEPPVEAAEDRRDVFAFRFWAGIIAIAAAVFLGFGIVAYVSSYLDTKRVETPVSSPAAEQESATATDEAQVQRESYDDLQDRIQDVAKKLEELQTEARSKDDQIKRVTGKSDSDPLEVRKWQQELQALRQEIVSKESELRGLKMKQENLPRP